MSPGAAREEAAGPRRAGTGARARPPARGGRRAGRSGTAPRLAVLQHEPETGLGAFAALLDRHGVDRRVVGTRAGKLPAATAFDAALVLGGSIGAHDPDLREARRWIREAVAAGVPVLGVCLGAQLLALALGGEVVRARQPEVGLHHVFATDAAVRDPVFAGLPRRLRVFGWHEDAFTLPRGTVPLAGSMRCTHEAFRHGDATYGLQFHAEVRPDDLVRWREVAAYRDVLARSGGDWERVGAELEGAAEQLGLLASRLLLRWLSLAIGLRPSLPGRAGVPPAGPPPSRRAGSAWAGAARGTIPV